jgi:hypothetical protein
MPHGGRKKTAVEPVMRGAELVDASIAVALDDRAISEDDHHPVVVSLIIHSVHYTEMIERAAPAL